MFSIHKACAAVTVLSMLVAPITTAFAQGPSESGTETFNAAPGGERKAASSAATIPGKIAATRIPWTVTVKQSMATDKAAFKREVDASAPAKARGEQGAPSELSQK